MITLFSQGSFECSAGRVFSFTSLPPSIRHPRELIGQVVQIDGAPRHVRGVEHWAITCPRADERCEHPYGLLVGEPS